MIGPKGQRVKIGIRCWTQVILELELAGCLLQLGICFPFRELYPWLLVAALDFGFRMLLLGSCAFGNTWILVFRLNILVIMKRRMLLFLKQTRLPLLRLLSSTSSFIHNLFLFLSGSKFLFFIDTGLLGHQPISLASITAQDALYFGDQNTLALLTGSLLMSWRIRIFSA
jgi:hypothetical protein